LCGLAGYIGKYSIGQEKIKQCLKLMNRRGPDASGFYNTTYKGLNTFLLHTRLSIIDINHRSNQPFHTNSSVLIYNGELYNYIELRKELLSLGYTFETNGDTEVLIKIISHFGWNGLDKCEGMWGFALYNKQNGSLMLSRDRFGEKPLYIFRSDHGIYFGSEIKFIDCLNNQKLYIDFNHVYRYLVNGYKSLHKSNYTFFQNIESLNPGSVLLIDNEGNEQLTKYWEPVYNIDSQMTYDDAINNTKDLLLQSLKFRLRSDVPMAFCMSGGVDSNSLISIAKNIFNYDVHGFTIVEKDVRYDEEEMVDYCVNNLGIKHTKIFASRKKFIFRLKELIRQHDAPVYTISYYAHWLLMKAISEYGYKISVSGTAADEIFSGYYDHHNAFLYEVKDSKEIFQKSLMSWNKHIKPIVRNPFLQDPYVFINNPNMRDHIFLDSEIFSDYLNNQWMEPFSEKKYCNGLLKNRMLNELFHESVPVILHEDDHNAMYFSIENRSPFLDKHLFEWSTKIPTSYLVQDGMAKAVLRQAMKGMVPENIIEERRKVGFNASISSFLDLEDKEVKSYLLDQSPIFDHVKRSKIETLISKKRFPNSESKFLFYFLCTKIFLEEFS